MRGKKLTTAAKFVFSAYNNFVHALLFYNVRIAPATDHVIGTCAQKRQCENWQTALPCLAISSVEQQPILLCYSACMLHAYREGCVGKDEEAREMWKGERKANSLCCELHNSLAKQSTHCHHSNKKSQGMAYDDNPDAWIRPRGLNRTECITANVTDRLWNFNKGGWWSQWTLDILNCGSVHTIYINLMCSVIM